MVIAHNLMALNTGRNSKINTSNKGKVTEKLASGYRINRSADDAAGLSISEKMRQQIRGLDRASANIQDGVSLVQIAEAALGEMHSLLDRMKELTTQAANDTNTDEDRSYIKDELDTLSAEIDHISETTMFNTRKLLSPPGNVKVQGMNDAGIASMIYPVTDGNGNLKYGTTLDFSNVAGGKENLIGKEFEVSCSANCQQKFKFKFTDDTTSTATTEGGGGNPNLVVSVGLNDPALVSGEDIANKLLSMAKSQASAMGGTIGGGDAKIGHANGMSTHGSTLVLYALGSNGSGPVPTYAPGMGQVKADGLDTVDMKLHIQAGERAWQDIPIDLSTINATTLGVNALFVDSFESAGKSMDSVEKAIEKVSEKRSYFGATQNRLEDAKKLDDNTSENTQAAESRIRDANMAQLTMENAKLNILEQSITSMLSQANRSPEGVLSLLS